MESQEQSNSIAAARAVASQVVREQFPEFVGVEPQLAERMNTPLHHADAQRLGTNGILQVATATEYTFIFSRELRTADGFSIPRIARITVDTHQHVVKAVMSK